MESYLVGGAVRDKLLNRSVKDRDWVVVGETPEVMIKAGFKPIGKDFPVFLHPETFEEYALARTERKVGKGYTGFKFHASPDVTLEEDLKRRDLTVNAIAMTKTGQLIDPYQGVEDIKNRVLRHVSPAFSEDPVRILRVARFMARYAPLGFSVANETMVLMREMVKNGEVDALVSERVWQELNRALCEPAPEKFFETLRYCGALKKLMPELDQLFGVPNPPHHHPEIDTGIHTMMVLQQASRLSDDPEIRFAALLHDLGKGITPISKWPSHYHHENKGVSLVKMLCDRFKTPKAYRELAIVVCQYHTDCHRSFEFRPQTLLKLFEKTDAIRRPDRFKKLLMACQADSQGRIGFENNKFSQRDFLLKILEVIKQVDISSLIEEGLEGMKLANAIRKMRVDGIKRCGIGNDGVFKN